MIESIVAVLLRSDAAPGGFGRSAEAFGGHPGGFRGFGGHAGGFGGGGKGTVVAASGMVVAALGTAAVTDRLLPPTVAFRVAALEVGGGVTRNQHSLRYRRRPKDRIG